MMYRCKTCGRLFIGSDTEETCPYCDSTEIEEVER